MKKKELYSHDWLDTIRPEALKRALYRCTKCGINHKQSVLIGIGGVYIKIDDNELIEYINNGKKAYKIYLQVHHVNGDKSDNRNVNLQVLCPRCHLSIERAKNSITRQANKR